jgi:hypothetical protein
MTTLKSSSAEQRVAEKHMIAALNKELDLTLLPQKKEIGNGISVKFDGLDQENQTLCEIYARIGKLKGSQPDKVAGDILKMILAEKTLGGHWRKLICFADEGAAQSLKGRSWLAEVVRRFEIEVKVILLPEDVGRSVQAAQERQVMVNRT